MAMLRARVAAGSDVPMRLLLSSRSWERAIYRDELERLGAEPGVGVWHTITGPPPPGWTGFARRVDADMLAEVGWSPDAAPLAYICGPTGFVEAASRGLVELGHDPARIRTERFGPTGGGA